MKRILTLTLLMLIGTFAFGQATRVDIPLLTSGPNVPSTGGPLPQALWVANATVSICTHPSNTYAACLASPTTTYTDSGEGTTCASTKQMVQLPGASCTSNAGTTANVGFWYGGGIVDYWVVSAYGTFGPFTVNPGAGGGGGATWGGITNGSQTTPHGIQINTLPGVLQTAREPLNIVAYGAVGDGTTDDTTAIQTAITAACAAGTSIYVPATLNGYVITKSLNATSLNGCSRAFFILGEPDSGFFISQFKVELTEAYPAVDFGGCNACGTNYMYYFLQPGSMSTVALLNSSANDTGGGFNFQVRNTNISVVNPNPPNTIGIVAYSTDLDVFSDIEINATPVGMIAGNSIGRASAIRSKFYTFPTTFSPGFTAMNFNNVAIESLTPGGTCGPALQLTGSVEYDFTGENYLNINGCTANSGGVLELSDTEGFTNTLNGTIRTEVQTSFSGVCSINVDTGAGIENGNFSGSLNSNTGGISVCGTGSNQFILGVNWSFNTTNPTAFNWPGKLRQSNIVLQSGVANSAGTIGAMDGGILTLNGVSSANILAAITNGAYDGATTCGSDMCITSASNLANATGTAVLSSGSIGPIAGGSLMNLVPYSSAIGSNTGTLGSGGYGWFPALYNNMTVTNNTTDYKDPYGGNNATKLVGSSSGNNDIVDALQGNTFTASISGTVMTVTSSPAVPIQVGQQVTGSGVTAFTVITSLGSGTGGAGTYNINNSQTISSQTMYGSELLANGIYQICGWSYSPNNISVSFSANANGGSITNKNSWGYNCFTVNVGPPGSNGLYNAFISSSSAGAFYVYGINIAPVATPSAGYVLNPTTPIRTPYFGYSPNFPVINPTPTATHCVNWFSATSVGDSGSTCFALLTGTTGTITGTALTASCDSGTATVTGATVGHTVGVSTTDGTDIGGAFNIRASVTASNTVTVYVCGTGTPGSKAYNVTTY